MTAEQQFDLIAEAGWELCRCEILGFYSACCFKHQPDMQGTDLGQGHYDTHSGSAMIPVRECFRADGKYIYQKRKWPK